MPDEKLDIKRDALYLLQDRFSCHTITQKYLHTQFVEKCMLIEGDKGRQGINSYVVQLLQSVDSYLRSRICFS